MNRGCRRRICSAVFALTLPLCACTKHITNTVLDLDCGAVKLRFREDIIADFNVTRIDETLLVSRGNDWVPLDGSATGSASGAEHFSRLLPADAGFRSFPFDEKRPRVKDEWSRTWAVFADPAVVDRAEYDAISACLAGNVAAIDKAFQAARPDGGTRMRSQESAERAPQLSSIIHARHDLRFANCDPAALGGRWDCADGRGYIKTVIDDPSGEFRLCSVAEGGTSTGGGGYLRKGMVVGRIAGDQSAVFLGPPETYTRAYQDVLANRQPREYYATCRDSAGRGFFDVFPAARIASAGPAQPGSVEDHKAQGTRLMKEKKHTEAIKHFRAITVLEPKEDAGYIDLGNALLEIGRYAEAVKAYREAARLKPSAVAYYNLGLALQDLEQQKQALVAFEKASQLEPGNVDTEYKVADALLMDLRYDDAIARYKVVTGLEPTKARAYQGLGIAFYWKKQCAESTAAFQKAVRLCATCLEPGEKDMFDECRTRIGR